MDLQIYIRRKKRKKEESKHTFFHSIINHLNLNHLLSHIM